MIPIRWKYASSSYKYPNITLGTHTSNIYSLSNPRPVCLTCERRALWRTESEVRAGAARRRGLRRVPSAAGTRLPGAARRLLPRASALHAARRTLERRPDADRCRGYSALWCCVLLYSNRGPAIRIECRLLKSSDAEELWPFLNSDPLSRSLLSHDLWVIGVRNEIYS